MHLSIVFMVQSILKTSAKQLHKGDFTYVYYKFKYEEDNGQNPNGFNSQVIKEQ